MPEYCGELSKRRILRRPNNLGVLAIKITAWYQLLSTTLVSISIKAKKFSGSTESSGYQAYHWREIMSQQSLVVKDTQGNAMQSKGIPTSAALRLIYVERGRLANALVG